MALQIPGEVSIRILVERVQNTMELGVSYKGIGKWYLERTTGGSGNQYNNGACPVHNLGH